MKYPKNHNVKNTSKSRDITAGSHPFISTSKNIDIYIYIYPHISSLHPQQHFNLCSLWSLTLHVNVQILLTLPWAHKQTETLGGLQSSHMLGTHSPTRMCTHPQTHGQYA